MLKVIKPLIFMLFCLQLVACGRIKSYFPDKEKDYQLSHEIPSLALPADLKDNSVNFEVAPLSTISSNVASTPMNETIVSHHAAKEPTIYVGLLAYSGGATRIRIEDSIERSWRLVGKALSHHSIEIIDRNENNRQYSVLYDADFKKFEDGSLLDEVLFIFAPDPAKEKEFHIKLAENSSLTEVIILDADDKPLSKGAGLKLITLIYQSIKNDLATK